MKMEPEAWFARHESMTDADFEKDPTRNKLAVLVNRTNHLSSIITDNWFY